MHGIMATRTDNGKSCSLSDNPKMMKGFKYPKLNGKSKLTAYSGRRGMKWITG